MKSLLIISISVIAVLALFCRCDNHNGLQEPRAQEAIHTFLQELSRRLPADRQLVARSFGDVNVWAEHDVNIPVELEYGQNHRVAVHFEFRRKANVWFLRGVKGLDKTGDPALQAFMQPEKPLPVQ